MIMRKKHPDTRTGRAVTNMVFHLGNQLLLLFLSFISRTVFVRVFGMEYLGLNGLFSDVLGLLSMADLGFGTAMAYSFYKPLAMGDYRKMAALTGFYRKVYRMIAAAVAGIGMLLIPFLPLIVNLETPLPGLTAYYLFSLSDVTASYLCVHYSSLLIADQKNYVVTRISMIMNFLRTLLQLIIMLTCGNYTLYLGVTVLASAANNAAASLAAVRRYPFLRKKEELSGKEQKEIYQNTWSVLLYKVSSTLINATDNILISVMAGTGAVGIYSNYLMLQGRITRIISLLFGSLTAGIGNLVVKETATKQFEVFQCMQSVCFLLSGVIVPCYGTLVNDFVSLWLGTDYILPSTALYAATLNLYLSCILQPLWSYREATGLYRKTRWVMAVCAFLNLVLSVLLGAVLGIGGILISSGISRIATYVWYEPKLLFAKYFGRRVKAYYLQLAGNLLFVAGTTACLTWLGTFFPENTWKSWFVRAVLSTGVSMAATGMIYFRSKGVQLLCKRFYKGISKRCS